MNIWKPKLLDYYILKKFLGTFFFSLLMIIVIVVVIDISEKVEDFIEHEVTLREIVFDYYVNFIPYFASMFSSLFIFISVIFFTSKLASDTEIIAILSNGISFFRFMVPYFIGALILAMFSFALTNYVIPPANMKRLAFEDKYIHGQRSQNFSERNVHLQIAPGVFAYMESYSISTEVANRFSLEEFDGNRLKSKLMADFARYDSISGKWVLENWYIRNLDGESETITTGFVMDTTLLMHPNEFTGEKNITDVMTLGKLSEEIKKLRSRGAENVRDYLVAKHMRLAFPFSTFILTLIGVSLSSRKTRGGIGIHVAIGIVLSFTYILLMQFSKEFAISGSISPVIATWIPNFLFLIVGLVLYRIAPK